MCLSPDVVIAVFPTETDISDPFDLVKTLLHEGWRSQGWWSGEFEGQTIRSPKDTFIFRVMSSHELEDKHQRFPKTWVHLM